MKLIRRQQGVIRGEGSRGRIDLFCEDKKNNNLVVIELKNYKADKDTFKQISNYIEGIKLFKKRTITGLVIGRGCNEEFKKLLEKSKSIKYLDLVDLGFE